MLRLLKFFSFLCSVKAGTSPEDGSVKQQQRSPLFLKRTNPKTEPTSSSLDGKRRRVESESDSKLSSELHTLKKIQAARKKFSPVSYKDAAVDGNGQRRVTLYEPASFNIEKKENLPKIIHSGKVLEIDVDHEAIVPKQNASDSDVAQDIWSRNFAITETNVLSRDNIEERGSISGKITNLTTNSETEVNPEYNTSLYDYVPAQKEGINSLVKKFQSIWEETEGRSKDNSEERKLERFFPVLSISDSVAGAAIKSVGINILGLKKENGWTVETDDVQNDNNDNRNTNRFIFTNQFPEPEKNLPYCLKKVIIESSHLSEVGDQRSFDWQLRHNLHSKGTVNIVHVDNDVPNPNREISVDNSLTYDLNLWLPLSDKYLALSNPTSEANSTLRPLYSEIMTPEFTSEEVEHDKFIRDEKFIQDKLKKYMTRVDLIDRNHMIAFFSTVKGKWSDRYPLAVPHIGVDSDKSTENCDKNDNIDNLILKSAETRFQVQMFKAE